MTATAELRGEFELLTRLRHPHIAAVHDWLPRSPIPSGEGDAGRSAYTQDLLKGTDFFSALREAPDAERDEAVEQLLRALAYLHALDVVHLDLKPDNVFVSRESGRVMTWVLDFGVAEHRGTLTDYVMGSRSYVAPERLSGEAVDPRADLFAVGVMMAEVSSGQPQALYTSPQLQDARRRRAYFESVGVDARCDSLRLPAKIPILLQRISLNSQTIRKERCVHCISASFFVSGHPCWDRRSVNLVSAGGLVEQSNIANIKAACCWLLAD